MLYKVQLIILYSHEKRQGWVEGRTGQDRGEGR